MEFEEATTLYYQDVLTHPPSCFLIKEYLLYTLQTLICSGSILCSNRWRSQVTCFTNAAFRFPLLEDPEIARIRHRLNSLIPNIPQH
jgi:hypothetical protein